MQQSTEALYKSISAGEGPDPAPVTYARHLQRMALAEAKSSDVSTRKGALRVALALPMSHGHPILWDLVIDPEPDIRQQVFERALSAQHEGLQLLRRAAESDDMEMAVMAVRCLCLAIDRPSLPIMRRLLNHTSADVRARAATFLGWTAGPAVRPKLTKLAEDDTSPEVREAADAALAALQDQSACPEPVWWWEAGAIDKPAPKKTRGAKKATKAAASKAPAKAEAPAAEAAVEEQGVAAIVREAGESKNGDHWTSLDNDQLQEVGKLLASVRPEDDLVLCIGLARCVAHYARPHWTVHLRPLLGANDATLKAHAAAGLGAIAGPSQIPWFRPLFSDSTSEVRLAAVQAFAHLCQRLERPDLLASYVGPLKGDTDPAVRQAVADAMTS